jgi:hypothetical protein
MERLDAYLPDPRGGFGYADFRAARARFFATLSEQAEIARLERALSMQAADRPAGIAASRGRDERSGGGAVRTPGEASG